MGIKKRLAQCLDTGPQVRTEIQAEGEGSALTPAEERRKWRMERARTLHQQGWTQKSVARHLNIHPKTVRRYLHSSSPKSRRSRTGSLLDPFKPYLLERWNEGCHNASQLFREIEPQGYKGETTIVRIFVQQLRQASGLPPKVRSQPGEVLSSDPTKYSLSLRKLTSLIVKREENRTAEGEELLAKVSHDLSKLATTISLARAFAAIVRRQRADQLDAWLGQASKSGYRIWQNFAQGLKQDYNAVRAALTLPWSNGPTEGHINRLKFTKRLMYGRGKNDLLRKRILWQGRWSFT